MAVHYPADYQVFSLVCIDDMKCTPVDTSIVKYVNEKLEKHIPEYGEFIATAEDDKTLYVMRDVEQIIGQEIIWVRGKSFDNVIDTPNTHGGCPTRLPGKTFRYCTDEMKLVPIFKWWFDNLGTKVKMRIGFRFDEFSRLERFVNSDIMTTFKIAVSCSTKGERRQKHEAFSWRNVSFPMIRDRVLESTVKDYWGKKIIGGNLFDIPRKVDFPVVSNCVGCPWKQVPTLAAMSVIHPSKMAWFERQEHRGKGTWVNGVTYDSIEANKYELAAEVLAEILYAGQTCDSGGCTD